MVKTKYKIMPYRAVNIDVVLGSVRIWTKRRNQTRSLSCSLICAPTRGGFDTNMWPEPRSILEYNIQESWDEWKVRRAYLVIHQECSSIGHSGATLDDVMLQQRFNCLAGALFVLNPALPLDWPHLNEQEAVFAPAGLMHAPFVILFY